MYDLLSHKPTLAERKEALRRRICMFKSVVEDYEKQLEMLIIEEQNLEKGKS